MSPIIYNRYNEQFDRFFEEMRAVKPADKKSNLGKVVNEFQENIITPNEEGFGVFLRTMCTLKSKDEILNLKKVVSDFQELIEKRALDYSAKLASKKGIGCSTLSKYRERVDALKEFATILDSTPNIHEKKIDALFNKTIALFNKTIALLEEI